MIENMPSTDGMNVIFFVDNIQDSGQKIWEKRCGKIRQRAVM